MRGTERTVWRWLAMTIALLTLLTGCDQQAMIERIMPKPIEEFARHALRDAAANDYQALEPRLDETLRTPEARQELEKIAEAFPEGEPLGVETLGANSQLQSDGNYYQLTLQYQYPERWIIASAVVRADVDGPTIVGLHAKPLDESTVQANRFTFIGKGALHYVFFALTIAVPLFILTTLAVLLRTRIRRRKWLWFLYVAFGIGLVSLNWTTGETSLKPLYFGLLGAGFFKGGFFSPLVLHVCLPVGAIHFLLRRRALVAAAAPDHATPAATDPPA